MQAYLRVTAGPDTGRVFHLTEGSILTIGRGEKSDTKLHDQGVARLHCQLQWEGTDFTLLDLESVNGTFVGGTKIEQLALTQDQEFQIGATRIKLHTDGISNSQHVLAVHKPAAEPEPKPETPVLTGKTISHYELGALLARGRTGTIYKARDTRAAKDVAVKVLHPDVMRDGEDARRFKTAVTAAVELRHPNLVAFYGAGRQGDTCWFAMEYVDGEPLSKLIERSGAQKTFDWRFALAVGTQIAHALEATHEKHVVHRNVSPEHILIRKKDHVAKLGDTIRAKAFDPSNAEQISRPDELGADAAYMAPERTRGDVEVDTRADVYGLGATLYTLLTGKLPFEGKTVVELINHIRHDTPLPPRKFQDAIPEKLQDAVMLMLSKRPELRYQTPTQAARAFELLAKHQGPRLQ
jgi:eukaryotic-like serine/threonine-protein kinase